VHAVKLVSVSHVSQRCCSVVGELLVHRFPAVSEWLAWILLVLPTVGRVSRSSVCLSCLLCAMHDSHFSRSGAHNRYCTGILKCLNSHCTSFDISKLS